MDAIFFPRKDYDVEVCNHRHGKTMTYTDQTDKLELPTFNIIMPLVIQQNIKVGAFVNSLFDTVPNETINQYIAANRLWVDVYWRYSEMTGQTNVDATTYAQKTAKQIQSFVSRFGFMPCAMSYGLGNYTYADYVKNNFIGGRNSLYTGNNTDYGKTFGGNYLGNPQVDYSLDRFTNKNGTFRFYDDAERNGYESAANQLETLINATRLNGGWFNNFSHWHDYINHNHQQWLEDYIALLGSKQTQFGGEIYFAGYGEAVAYLVYRTLITRAVMYSPIHKAQSQLIIRLQTDNTLSINPDLLTVPISIKFSLAGTPLAGAEIKSNRNLISLGNDDYIAELPFERFPYAIIERV